MPRAAEFTVDPEQETVHIAQVCRDLRVLFSSSGTCKPLVDTAWQECVPAGDA